MAAARDILSPATLAEIARRLDDAGEGRPIVLLVVGPEFLERLQRPAIEPLWTVEEVAAYLKQDVKYVYNITRRGARRRLASVRLGKELRFDPEMVRGWFRDYVKERMR